MTGIVSTGAYATNLLTQAEHATVLPPEALIPLAELAAPLGLTNLPPLLGQFVGRTEVLARLDETLENPGGVVVQAVHGLGGIGKSTLAAHWAATRNHGHHPIWWITADSPASLDAGLAALATALQPELSVLLSFEALRERAVQWLAAQPGWLVILDNVNDPADVRPLLSRTRQGRFLITSRRTTGWHQLATPVPVDVLDQTEAMDLLTTILDRAPGALNGAADLCEELGGLPLAIEQAGAYIVETGITPRTYLDLLAAHPATMYRHSAEGTDPSRTIARIWHITLDRLADDPLTGIILRVLAWYAPDHIPRSLLDGLADSPELTRAIGRLAAYSLLTTHHDNATLSVHRLVQAVTRTPDPETPHRLPHLIDEARTHATAQLGSFLPEHWDAPAHWPTFRTLLPHVDALTSQTSPDADTEVTAGLLNLAGLFLCNQGAVPRAIRYHQRALTDYQRVLGEEHLDTLSSRNNLAHDYLQAGDLGRALPLYEQTLTGSRRLLGRHHPSTLFVRHNLAGVYMAAGDLGRAVPLIEQTLTDRRRVLGEDHPDTLTSRHDLAYVYVEAGDPGRAVPLLKQTITDRRRVLGEDHPDTLASRHNLAHAYVEAGDPGRAVPLLKQTITDCRRVLGEDHPLTLSSCHNLAHAYLAEGDLGPAITLYEQTLTDHQRVLGEDHPHTLSNRAYLARAYKEAGDPGRAVSQFAQILTDCRRVLGEDHPDTLGARQNLADAYLAKDDLDRAIALYEQAVTDYQRVLGMDHPRTVSSRSYLARAYQEAGEPGRAVPLYEQCLTDCQRLLGERHTDTLGYRSDLAWACLEAGDFGRAVRLLKQAVTDYQRVLGTDHPRTVSSRSYLAYAYLEAGDLGRAGPLLKRCLTDCRRVLGEEHPLTALVSDSLADVNKG